MNKEVISGKQVAFLLFMFLNSGILLIGQKSVAGADSWIALILAALCIVPFLLCAYQPPLPLSGQKLLCDFRKRLRLFFRSFVSGFFILYMPYF